MTELESPSPQRLLTESIIFGSIGLLLLILRIISRVIAQGGLTHLQLDDFFMSLSFCFYTALLILIQISARFATNLIPLEDLPAVLADPQDVANRIYGSQIVIALEFCMMAVTWGVKACLLTMYYRLTLTLPKHHRIVQGIIGYVVVGYIVIEVTYFAGWCRPFSQYWAVPVDNLQCATYRNYSIMQAVFNISSDILIIFIPIPLVWKAGLPRRSKVALTGVFSLGFFVILAASLNKFYNFLHPLTTIYMLWYIREASTSLYVANLLCLWPLLRKMFGIRPFQVAKPTGYSGPAGYSGPTGYTTPTDYRGPPNTPTAPSPTFFAPTSKSEKRVTLSAWAEALKNRNSGITALASRDSDATTLVATPSRTSDGESIELKTMMIVRDERNPTFDLEGAVKDLDRDMLRATRLNRTNHADPAVAFYGMGPPADNPFYVRKYRQRSSSIYSKAEQCDAPFVYGKAPRSSFLSGRPF